MDSERFDDLIKRLGTTRLTRSSAIRGLAAGAMAAITGAVLSASGSDAKGKRRGKGRVKSQRAPQADAGKVTICHRTHSATNPVVEIEVSGNAVAKHVSQHGDFLKGDCCVDSQCSHLDDECNVGRCLVDDETNEGNCKAVCREVGLACDDANRCTEDDRCRRTDDDDDDDLSCSCQGRRVICPACLNCDPSSGECSIDTCPAGETCDPDTGQCEGGGACESDSECGANEVCCLIDGAKFEGQCAVRRNCCTSDGDCRGQTICCLAPGEHTNQCVDDDACP